MTLFGVTDVHIQHGSLVLLFLVPLLINIGILFIVLITLPNNRTNSSFLIFVFLLILWQLSDGIMRICPTEQAAIPWARISEAIILFVTPFALLFGLRFARWHKKVNPALLFVGLFLMPVLFLLGISVHDNGFTLLKSEYWNWVVNPKHTDFIYALYGWIALHGFVCMLLFGFIYFKKRKDPQTATPALLFALGFTMPTIGGIVCQVIGPLLFHTDDIPVTALLVTIFSALSLVAITKYQLLDYSPRHQWKNLVSLTSEGILIVNREDRIMYANECFCQLSGYTYKELEGKPASGILPDRPKIKMDREESVKAGNNPYDKKEIQLITKGGQKMWTLFSGSPYLDSKGNQIGCMGIYTNIEALKTTEKLLEVKVQELNLFFYKASHDLKAPAASIKGLVSLYKISRDPLSEVIINAIEQSANKLIETTDRLSQIAIISERVPEHREISWMNMIDTILEKIYEGQDCCSCKSVIKMTGPFYSDSYLMDLIFRIALVNAFTYRKDSREECKVHVNVVQEISGVSIRIADNGCGIPEELRRNIFTLFCRGEGRSGIGLGLYTLKLAVDKLGGQVSLNSEPGRGTELHVKIPFDGTPSPY